MTSYDRRFMTKLWLLLLLLPVVRADLVCVTSDSGTTKCQNKLTTGTIVALVATVVLLLALLGSAIAFLLYRRRRFAAAKAAVAANAYVIEAAQMKGPAPYTTYDPAYDPSKPGSAGTTKTTPKTAPTTYGGVTFPFPGYSSPKGTPPRSHSAFSGTYTTMGSAGQTGAV